MRGGWLMALAPPLLMLSAPAVAQDPRDLLTHAAFEDRNRDIALARVDRVRALALARAADDQDSAVLAAIAQGYRAKLTGSRSEATAARKQFEAVATRYPRNPEAQLGLAAWHLGVINRVGRFVGRLVGAQRGIGLAALERSVTLGGNRAMFAGLAGMMLIESNPGDKRGKSLIETASNAATPTSLDRVVQRSSTLVLGTLRRGKKKEAQVLADRLLPFGWYKHS